MNAQIGEFSVQHSGLELIKTNAPTISVSENADLSYQVLPERRMRSILRLVICNGFLAKGQWRCLK